MQDFIKRLLIAGLMALCVSLLFLGGKHSQAEMLDIPELTSDWIWPAKGVVTDVYGTRHGHHKGIDIAAEFKEPIHTVADGVVTKSYYSGTYGHVVFIKHENNLETVYAHLYKRKVIEGQTVKQGDIIGEMGNTGDSSGVHLHFEIHKEKWTYEKENAVNPVIALGDATIGQPVIALEKQQAYSLETIAKLRMADDTQIGSSGNQESQEIVKAPIPEKEETLKHMVQKGESLWSIAIKYKTSVDSLAQKNNIKDSKIVVGDILVIDAAEQDRYIVLAGDSLNSIAEKTKTSVGELKALNHLTTDVIQPQQILITR
ncbi:MAG: peptidoglycan DD-metalloendopeptidase family protein [Mesobacillus sp.]|uniref:peptidoglycan DD-metalloendopeptidase family protein n=1 Tax=Mesobacillus sp. TaxID=2675271 RepID=UPI003C59A50E